MKATCFNEITETAESGIAAAAAVLGASVEDVRGYFLAGGDWDASTAQELADLIVECWNEQQNQAAL